MSRELARSDSDAAGGDPTKAWLLFGLGFFCLYAFASLVPRGDTWGLHSLAYLHPVLRVGGLVACFVLLWRPVQERVFALLDPLAGRVLGDSPYARFLPLLLAGIGFAIFYSFPIRTEVYGDTRTILRHWADNSQLPPLASLFDLRIHKNDAALTHVLLRTVAHSFSISIEQAFRIVSALSGALCLALWAQFVRTSFAGSRWAVLLFAMGCLLGAHQIFFGHVETYAFVYLTFLAFLVSSYLLLEGRASIWTVLVLFLVALKAHAIAICFLPAVTFLVVHRFRPRASVGLNWTWASRYLIGPTLAIAAALYVFYFRSFAAPYTGPTTGLPQTFLPVVAAHGPRDYSLFSAAHLLDLGNVLLLVGAPVLILVLGVGLFHRRATSWQHPTILFAGLALLFPLLFLGAVNPLLSMSRDWDLYALLGAPLLLLLAAVLAHGNEHVVPTRPLYGTALAFGVFSLGFCVLNATHAPLSHRLEQVGEHVYRTYHTNASYLIGTAQGMEPDATRSVARRLATVKRLAPARVENDQEYSHLLMMLAAVYRERGERDRAVWCVEQAVAAQPLDLDLALYFADYLVWANETERAEKCLAQILEKAPTQFDALVLAAITAAKKKDYGRALAFLERAGRVSPGDADVALWTANMKAQLGQTRAGARKDS